MNKSKRRELENALLSKEQKRELKAFDKSVRYSNRKFYDNHLIRDPFLLDNMTPTVLDCSQNGGKRIIEDSGG